jgi:hypothetical protein
MKRKPFNSKAQQEHERENKERLKDEEILQVDKKLNGPNRPAE